MSAEARRFMAFLLLFFCVFGTYAQAETVWGDLDARFAEVPTVEYQGQSYRLRSRLTTILLLGVDRRQDQESAAGEYRSGGQADFQLLLVVDDNRKTIQPLQINRDTMTEITVLSVVGHPSGSRTAQICLAHGYGDGREQSCALAVEAVEGLLLDTPVDCYFAMNLDGISALNDAIGGVEVTLEEDFSAYDAAMTAGTTLTLRGEQAEYFVRYRYSVGDQSNLERQRRQKTYLSAVKEILVEKIRESSNYAGKLFDLLEPYSVTDMSRGRMINLANKANQYEILPVAEIDGEALLGESGYMEFYPDEDALVETVLETFYETSQLR